MWLWDDGVIDIIAASGYTNYGPGGAFPQRSNQEPHAPRRPKNRARAGRTPVVFRPLVSGRRGRGAGGGRSERRGQIEPVAGDRGFPAAFGRKPRPARRRRRGEPWRAGALRRPRRRPEGRSHRGGESGVLGGRSRRRSAPPSVASGARAARPRPCRRFSGACAVGGPAAASRARAAARRATAAVVARRAHHRARRGCAEPVRRSDARASRGRRPDHSCDPRAARGGRADPRTRAGRRDGGILAPLMTSPALALFLREWRIARRIGGGASIGAVFFLILVTIMPFALGPDMILLAKLGPAILWIAALLATLLGLDRLFQGDSDDGSLDVLVNSALPLEIVVLVKCAAHWASSTLPLICVSPLFGLMLAMDARPLALVAATLLAGTPALTMIGAIGTALTVSLRRGGLLMAVLVLPLAIPVLIFGVSAASAASGGASPFLTPFLMLCAISLFAIAGAPFAAAAAVRHVRE